MDKKIPGFESLGVSLDQFEQSVRRFAALMERMPDRWYSDHELGTDAPSSEEVDEAVASIQRTARRRAGE